MTVRSVGRSVGRSTAALVGGARPSADGVVDRSIARDFVFFYKKVVCVDVYKRWFVSTSMTGARSSRRRLDVRGAERGQHDGQHEDGVDEARGERDDDESCELCEEDDGTSEQAQRGGDG